MSKHTLTTLVLEPRAELGTTSAHRLRRAGKIPGTLYGHGSTTPITVDAKQLVDLILSGNKSHVVEATIGGAPDSVLLRRIEADPITRKPLSVDFQRVSRDEAVTSTVPVLPIGTAAGVRDGGVMDTVTHALEVRGPAASIPDHIEVDVSGLGLHQHLTAGEIPLPAGFTLLTPPDAIVVTVDISRANVGAGTDNAEAQPTEAPAG